MGKPGVGYCSSWSPASQMHLLGLGEDYVSTGTWDGLVRAARRAAIGKGRCLAGYRGPDSLARDLLAALAVSSGGSDRNGPEGEAPRRRGAPSLGRPRIA